MWCNISNGLFPLCSESLASFIETDLVPSIRQLELEAAEVEETGSHLGEYIAGPVCTLDHVDSSSPEVQIDATIEKVKQLEVCDIWCLS